MNTENQNEKNLSEKNSSDTDKKQEDMNKDLSKKDSSKKEPGNPHLEKTFDGSKADSTEDSSDDSSKELLDKMKIGSVANTERYTPNPNEKFPEKDKNNDKSIAKDMNNRVREAEKIQENEDKKNDDREIELNKKL